MATTGSMVAMLEQEGTPSPVIEHTVEQYLLMQTICQMGMAMCRCAEEGDFASLSDLYTKRDRVLRQVLEARESLRGEIRTEESKRSLNAFFEPVLQSIEHWDERLVTILRSKKDYIVEKSKEAQLHRLIARYLV
jgi:hypothetical protein